MGVKRNGKLVFFRRSRKERNFGDELSPLIVDALRRRFGLGSYAASAPPFFALGSVLHKATDGAVVWGSGVNVKMTRPQDHAFSRLDVRAVRGPHTRRFLLERGVDCPEVFGDPGLLMPQIVDRAALKPRPPRGVLLVPNLNDFPRFEPSSEHRMVSPLVPWWVVLREILSAELVVGSSLHAIILAEAFGVPARVLLPDGHAEPPLKYLDYVEGTGRAAPQIASTVREAIRLGGQDELRYDPAPLIEAFPRDIFEAAGPLRRGLWAVRRGAGLWSGDVRFTTG